MLNINPDIFNKNLSITQDYCENQLLHNDKSCVSILRSINPEKNGNKMFSFSQNKIFVGSSTPFLSTKWHLDPIDNTNLIEDLFELQISIKEAQNSAKAVNTIKYKGRIFVFKIDETLIDGAAAFASNGFLDDFNFPPIDTWFYLTTNNASRILLAWIPIKFVEYANDGICVNPENCIDWFDVWYSSETEKQEKEKHTTKFSQFIFGLQKLFKK